MSISGREPYGGGGGELDRNQQQSPTSNSLAFRTAAAAADGSVYKPIMPPSISIPNINNNNDDGNPFHHVALQHHHHHHHQELVGLGGGVGVGFGGVDGLNNMNNTEPIKRKRGRPRKYSPPPHNNIGIDLTTPPQQSPLLYNNQNNNSNSNQCGGGDRFQSSSSPTAKKARGRPPGSSARKNHIGTGGTGFTPHLITVKPGEDVLLKIMSFSQNGPRGVCILSAYGTISNVTLRQAATSGGTVTYEGGFEILSLSGSFLLSENSGQRSRTGGLSVLLSGPDGRVLGGGVAGLLTAASSVQVIVGSFISEESKGSKQLISQPETMSAPGVSVAGSPPSRGTFSESSGGPGSPPNQSTGACNPQGMPNLAWN